MNKLTHLGMQISSINDILQQIGEDPVLVPQLRERLSDAEAELDAARNESGDMFPEEESSLPRVAIFLRGMAVEGTTGIRPTLAGEMLIQYERMYVEQAIADERRIARNQGRQRRQRGAPDPELLFVGTPRGSFGLEFTPKSGLDSLITREHGESLKRITDAILEIANDDSDAQESISRVPRRLLAPIKSFFKTLAAHDAEVRFAFSDRPSQLLPVGKVKQASERLEREILEESLSLRGTFRGITLDSLQFDLNSDDQSTISGTVSERLDDEQLDRLIELTNQRCVAEVTVITIRYPEKPDNKQYILNSAEAES